MYYCSRKSRQRQKINAECIKSVWTRRLNASLSKEIVFADAGPVGNGILMNLQTSAKNRSARQKRKRRVIWSRLKIFFAVSCHQRPFHFGGGEICKPQPRVLSARARERESSSLVSIFARQQQCMVPTITTPTAACEMINYIICIPRAV
jgi:hypothetical protein